MTKLTYDGGIRTLSTHLCFMPRSLLTMLLKMVKKGKKCFS